MRSEEAHLRTEGNFSVDLGEWSGEIRHQPLLQFCPDGGSGCRLEKALFRCVKPAHRRKMASYVVRAGGFWDAAVKENGALPALDEARRFPICAPGPLRALFAQAGLEQIEWIAIDVPTVFRDFDDYWTPFLGDPGPAPAYVMSLSEENRIALRETLRGSLQIGHDGSISLVARAWSIRRVTANVK